jgi:hypothetical protein
MVSAQVATTTTLAITSGGNVVTTVIPGTLITLTATVMAGGAAVTPGQVNFCVATANSCTDIHLLGMAQLIQSGPGAGTAVLTFYPAVGNHSYKAVFLGTTGYAESSSNPSPLTVAGKYPTTTTIAQSGGPGNYTLTATVTGRSNRPPDGTVSFLDTDNSNYVLGQANLTPGSGSAGLDFPTTWDLTADTSLWTGYPIDDVEVNVFTGDFNGDGKLDQAVLWLHAGCSGYQCLATSELDILLGNGDGTFTAAPPAVPLKEGLFVGAAVAGDFNGDGKQDIALLLGNPKNILDPADWLQVLLGNGDGTFTPLPAISLPPSFGNLATGDFNGDGKLDLVGIIFLAIPGPRGYTQHDVYVTTLLGNGDGTFQSPETGPLLTTAILFTSNLAVADLNGDGNLDLAFSLASTSLVAVTDTSTVIVLLGNGDGTFTQTAQSPATGEYPTSIAVADFNGDGIPDLAIVNQVSDTLTIQLGNGDGTFTPTAVSPAIGSFSGNVAVGNFDEYGNADLVAAGVSTATVLLGSGDGTFSDPVSVPASIAPNFITVADFNGDGLSDLAVAQEGLDTGVPPPDAGVLLDHLTGEFSATATVTGISPVGTGTHWVDASYSGNSSYSASISGTTPLVAEPAATALAVTANPTGGTGNQILLTATLNPTQAQNHSPSGAMTFYNGNTILGTGSVSSGVATLTTSALPLGTDSITAVYPGDTNFIGSTSPVLPLVLDFSISASTNSPSIYTGQSATYTVTVKSSADFNLPVALSCSQLPANTTCSFSPATLTGGSGSSTLVVQTNAPSKAATDSGLFTKLRAPLLSVLLLLIIPGRLRRNRKGWPMFLVILAILVAGASIVACSPPGPLTGATPVGTQTITVAGTATNGSQTLTHTANVTLNINSLF